MRPHLSKTHGKKTNNRFNNRRIAHTPVFGVPLQYLEVCAKKEHMDCNLPQQSISGAYRQALCSTFIGLVPMSPAGTRISAAKKRVTPRYNRLADLCVTIYVRRPRIHYSIAKHPYMCTSLPGSHRKINFWNALNENISPHMLERARRCDRDSISCIPNAGHSRHLCCIVYLASCDGKVEALHGFRPDQANIVKGRKKKRDMFSCRRGGCANAR